MKEFIELNGMVKLKDTAEMRDQASLVFDPRKPPVL
jgi:hypothetical protein